MSNKLCLVAVFSIILIACENVNKDRMVVFKESPNKTIIVKDQIVEIQTDMLLGFGEFCIIDSFLVFNEYASKESKGIHLFNKNTFDYITSTGYLGRGPGEIIGLGSNGVSPDQSVLWVDDHGNQVRWKFPLDSILGNENFLPQEKIAMNPDFFLREYEFLNDTTVLGIAVIPLSVSSMEMATAKSNFSTGTTEKFGYKHPDIKDRYETYAYFKLSVKHNIYVNCYERIDLMTICDLEGNLVKNIYGEHKNTTNVNFLTCYFKGVDIYKDFILVSYLGKRELIKEEGKAPEFFAPTRLLVFDVTGNFVKSIEIGYQFTSFCVDEDNNRVIMYFNDRDNPLGYFCLESVDL